ncbi:hypothetical protein [Frankia sp. CcWB2]
MQRSWKPPADDANQIAPRNSRRRPAGRWPAIRSPAAFVLAIVHLAPRTGVD